MKPEHRRALALLAEMRARKGCAEETLRTHGFSAPLVHDLIRAGSRTRTRSA
jgi:hypothetical protein